MKETERKNEKLPKTKEMEAHNLRILLKNGIFIPGDGDDIYYDQDRTLSLSNYTIVDTNVFRRMQRAAAKNLNKATG